MSPLEAVDDGYLHIITSYRSNKGAIPRFGWTKPLFRSVVVGGCPPWLGVESCEFVWDRVKVMVKDCIVFRGEPFLRAKYGAQANKWSGPSLHAEAAS